MDRLEYKGYLGSLEYSKEDNCLFGKVLGLPNALISYEGDTATELYNDFKEGIEHYLTHCKEEGVEPQKPCEIEICISIPSELYSRIVKYTENHGISIDAFVCDAIERRLEVVS